MPTPVGDDRENGGPRRRPRRRRRLRTCLTGSTSSSPASARPRPPQRPPRRCSRAAGDGLTVVNIGTVGALLDGLDGLYLPSTVINHDINGDAIRSLGYDPADTCTSTVATGPSWHRATCSSSTQSCGNGSPARRPGRHGGVRRRLRLPAPRRSGAPGQARVRSCRRLGARLAVARRRQRPRARGLGRPPRRRVGETPASRRLSAPLRPTRGFRTVERMTATYTPTTEAMPAWAAPIPLAARAEAAVKVYGRGGTEVRALDDVTVGLPAGRFTADHGPVGIRQEHADALPRRPRHADVGPASGSATSTSARSTTASSPRSAASASASCSRRSTCCRR